MKTISIFLVILFVATQSFGQNPSLLKEDYLQKSKSQKNTGWVLLAGGTTLAVIGAITFDKSDDWSSVDTGGFMVLGGAVAAAASIPFFISSVKNARKAATISFNYQKMYFPQQHTFIAKPQPAITLRIPL
ncbi:MAG TPA: hypothetical protein VLM44_10910 [Lutibacter sp.]|nr:hypothetical protein [Lutibacter sp.]